MSHRYNVMYGLKGDKAKTRQAFTMAMRRMGVSAQDRLELKRNGLKEREVKDITEYVEVQAYLTNCDVHQVGERQRWKTLHYLRRLWRWMGKTNPKTWTLETLIKCLKEQIGQDENGQWKKQNQVLELLGAFNRCFQGILPDGFSTGLKREAGELKDFWEIDEFQEFESDLEDTPEMSKRGWVALFNAQVNAGAREGTTGNTGILSLRWEDINFKTRRCRIHDKGTKGKPAIVWEQVPLDLFYWLDGWNKLMRWHEQYGRPTRGRVFPVSYEQYRHMFHNTRHRCTCRIKEDVETERPHILRRTHAQWSKRIGITLDNLCGDTGTYLHVGRYGVGWKDPKVVLQYYLTKEAWEYKEQDRKIVERLEKLKIKCPLPTLEKQIYIGDVSKFPSMDNGQIEVSNVRN